MTPPTVAIARLDAVLRAQYPYVLPARRRAILRHVFGKHGVVMVAHLITRIQEKPIRWTAAQAQGLGKALKDAPPPRAA
jgi:hypothetical protein